MSQKEEKKGGVGWGGLEGMHRHEAMKIYANCDKTVSSIMVKFKACITEL